MNQNDQHDGNWRESLRQRLDHYQKAISRSGESVRSWISDTKARTIEAFSRLTRSITGKRQKVEHARHRDIKPMRVDPGNTGHAKSRDTSTERLDVMRVDDTQPDKRTAATDPLATAPDKAYVKKNVLDRPDLQYITPGEPQLKEDTAVVPIIHDSLLEEVPQTTSQLPAVRLTPLEPLSSGQNGLRPVGNQMTVDEKAPSQSVLASLIPGLRQFMISYRKRRKADRSIRRNTRERVYRLKGYTTVAKVNRKRQSENRQRLLRRFLIVIIAFLAIILLFQIYNPFKDMTEWYRILGIDSLDDLTVESTTDQTTGSSIIITQSTGTIQITASSATTASTSSAR